MGRLQISNSYLVWGIRFPLCHCLKLRHLWFICSEIFTLLSCFANFLILFQELKERIVRVRENRRDGTPASESEFSEEMMDIRKEFVTIHGEMVLLKNYSSLNFAGTVVTSFALLEFPNLIRKMLPLIIGRCCFPKVYHPKFYRYSRFVSS